MENREKFGDEDNLLYYITLNKRHKKVLFIIIAISVIATGIISILSPKIYEARAVIVSATPQEHSSINAIASQFGLTSPQASNVSEIIALLNSNILMEKVIKKHSLIPVLLENDYKNKKESEKIWETIRRLKKDIYKARDNKLEGVIELTAEFKDPKIAADIIKYMLTELTDYMSSEAKRVADTNKEYLESLIEKNADPLIRQNIYSLIARQIETSMMAEVKENFAFKVLDPPKEPVRKIRPIIWINIIVAFFISLFSGVFLVISFEYFKNLKELRKNSES